jgi:N utilization substance protein B
MSEPSSKGPPGRAQGRELALWLLSHVESHPGGEPQAIDLFFREPPTLDPSDEFLAPLARELAALLDDRNARRWAQRLVEAYLADPAEIDRRIEAASQRWRLERMDRVDRNLLRLCAVELLRESTPRNVVVAEAVRLAARYGSERSAGFVNALAEALARTLRDSSAGEAGGNPAEDEPNDETAEES